MLTDGSQRIMTIAGLDPGFPVGDVDPFQGGFWPPTWAHFSENVCENERIGSCRGRAPARPLDPPMHRDTCTTVSYLMSMTKVVIVTTHNAFSDLDFSHFKLQTYLNITNIAQGQTKLLLLLVGKGQQIEPM